MENNPETILEYLQNPVSADHYLKHSQAKAAPIEEDKKVYNAKHELIQRLTLLINTDLKEMGMSWDQIEKGIHVFLDSQGVSGAEKKEILEETRISRVLNRLESGLRS